MTPLPDENESFVNDEFKVLICSANIGNKAPSAESLWAWIPEDGRIVDVPRISGMDDLDEPVPYDQQFFDIIAIGMQEASFDVKDEKSEEEKAGGNNRESSLRNLGGDCKELSVRDIATSLADLGSDTVAVAAKVIKGAVIDVPETIYQKTVKKTFKDIHSATGNEDHTKRGIGIRPKAIFFNDKDAAEFYGADTKYLYNLLRERCPSYQIVVMYLRGEMRLIILARNHIHSEISDVDYAAKNTGIGDVLANKGGIVATLTVRGTKLGFVTAHLEAHEGTQHFENRCANITEILGGAKVGPKPKNYDVSLYAHHTFVFGDLNFRVDLPLPQTPHEEKVDFVREKIEAQDWKYLNDNDELHKALREQKCLVGFQTLTCNFPPTFKVKREQGLVYNPQRLPSYTDRILWKSLDGIEVNIRPFAYHPCPGFVTSDHKPIRGAFSVQPPGAALSSYSRRKQQGNLSQSFYVADDRKVGERSLHIFCSDLSADLSASNADPEALNPYFSFTSQPLDVLPLKLRKKKFAAGFSIKGPKKSAEQYRSYLRTQAVSLFDAVEGATGKRRMTVRQQNKMWPRTSIKRTTLHPSWGDQKELHVSLNPDIHSLEQLEGAFLYATCFHADPLGADRSVGTAVFNLQKLLVENGGVEGMCEIELNEPLLKNGRVQGSISCKIEFWWFAKSQKKPPHQMRIRSVWTDVFGGFFGSQK